MKRSVKFLNKTFLALFFVAASAFGLGYLVGVLTQSPYRDLYTQSSIPEPPQVAVSVTPARTPIPLPTAAPMPSPTIAPVQEAIPNQSPDAPVVSSNSLIIPVVGIRAEDLRDTFNDSRSEGREHNAIDIMAPRGASVVAATDGEIIKFHDSVKGGITIYQMGRDKKTVYYYGHLERRADNLREGDFVSQGTTIGYVGDTGNSGAGNYHLHFAVWTVDDPKRFFEGKNINPYPLLRYAGK